MQLPRQLTMFAVAVPGLLLSAPLSTVSNWRFAGHSSICIPLPASWNTPKRLDYFNFIICINFVLSLWIAACKTVIYFSLQSTAVVVTNNTNQGQNISIIRCFSIIASSHVVCWFSLGLLNLLKAFGGSVPLGISGVLAIVVLPLNSAFNPFLYTICTLTEKRKTLQEQRLRKMLEARVKSRESKAMGARRPSYDSCFVMTTDDALKLLCDSLHSNTVSLGHMNASLLLHGLRLKVESNQ